MSPPYPIAVVTGSSSGIGQAIAMEFAAAVTACWSTAIKMFKAWQKRAKIESIYRSLSDSNEPPQIATELSDLSSPEGIYSFFARASDWASDRLVVWVNAAGTDVLTGRAKELSFADKLRLLWSVDVQATVLLSRMAAEVMKTPRSIKCQIPTIINIGWDQAERGMAGDSGQYFCAVKSAVASFSRSLAMSVGPHVRVNCLALGWIQTAWGEDAPATWQQRALGESALHRWGKPEDIARAAVWLSSPQAEFINGQVIGINGGWKPNYSE